MVSDGGYFRGSELITIKMQDKICIKIYNIFQILLQFQFQNPNLIVSMHSQQQANQSQEQPEELSFKYQQLFKSHPYSHGNRQILICIIIIPLILFTATYIFINMNHYTDSQNRVLNTLMKSMKRRIDRVGVKIKESTFREYINKAIENIEPEIQYMDIDEVAPFKQLPLCLILKQNAQQINRQIQQTIRHQKYKNYKVINLNQQGQKQNINYYTLIRSIQQTCGDKSVVVFISQKLKFGALESINNWHQRYNVWVIADVGKKSKRLSSAEQEVQIISVYKPVLDLIETNDFHNQVKYHLDSNGYYQKYITLTLLELCAYHMKTIDKQFLFEKSPSNQHFIGYSSQLQYERSKDFANEIIKRIPYQSLHYLGQDHPINLERLNQYLYITLENKFNESDPAMFNRLKSKFYNPVHNLKASQYEQMVYLPQNHSLFARQILHYQRQTAKDRANLNEKDVENPICVTVLNRNNVQHNRYLKLFKSIFQQNYTNYHIVFIDDVSTDETLAKAKIYTDFLHYRNIVYVQNNVRKYATYNIFHAAYQFCGHDDIQLLVDGDDELIGALAFQWINHKYQDKDAWVVYSGYKDDTYRYGYTEQFTQFYKVHDPIRNKRRMHHMMSPIRTWRVSLVRKIPFFHNKLQNGTWFESGYDNAIQLPLFELARVEHVKYVREMLYLSKRDYGDNDDATPQKIKTREVALNYVKGLKPLERLKELGGEDEQYRLNLKEFQRDEGSVFVVIHPSF